MYRRGRTVGEAGELWLRVWLATGGYYKTPEETARAFTADGWFKSGDLALRDARGRPIFRGRLREQFLAEQGDRTPAGVSRRSGAPA